MTTPRHTDTHRTCYRCEKLNRPAVHPVAEFTRRSNGTYFSACKACNKEMARERRAKVKLTPNAFAAWLKANEKKGAR